MPDDSKEISSRVIASVRGYLREQYSDRAEEVDNVGPSESLVERDLIDSLTFLGLVELLEAEFSVEVPADDFAPDQFQSLEEIAAYVVAARKG